MNKIIIVSVGAEPVYENLTIAAVKALKETKNIILKTERCGAAKWLENNNIEFTSLDNLYESSQNFDELNKKAADTVIKKAKSDTVCYAVLNASTDESVNILFRQYENIKIIPAVSEASNYMARSNISGQCIISTASELNVHEAQFPICILELDNQLLTSDCKLKLLPYYGEGAKTVFFENESADARMLSLTELDRQSVYSHRSAAIVFPNEILKKTRFDMEDLLNLMRILRSPGGCPWDKKQTHQSLRKYLIEEAYEAALAIDEEDDAHMQEELGDVLLQIALHSVIGEEYGTTSFPDIATDICKKMIERHSHVFFDDEQSYSDAEEVKDSWEKTKQEKRGNVLASDAMKEVKRGMPPLLRAEKIQKIASMAGYEFDKPQELLLKLSEDAEKAAAKLNKSQDLSAEIGDLLFMCINISRLCGLDAEKSLNMATEKLINRFAHMEKDAKSCGKAL
jgi:tetrapyrrole methylase family protein/MazG family protein